MDNFARALDFVLAREGGLVDDKFWSERDVACGYPGLIFVQGVKCAMTAGADEIAFDKFSSDSGCTEVQHHVGNSFRLLTVPVMKIEGGDREGQAASATDATERLDCCSLQYASSRGDVVLLAKAPSTVLVDFCDTVGALPAESRFRPMAGAKRFGHVFALIRSNIVGVAHALRIGGAGASVDDAGIGALVGGCSIEYLSNCMSLVIERGIKRAFDFVGGHSGAALPWHFSQIYVKGHTHASL